MWNHSFSRKTRTLLSTMAVFFVILLFFANAPAHIPSLSLSGNPCSSDLLMSADSSFVEIVNHEDSFSARAQGSLTNTPTKNSISFKLLKALVLLSIAFCLVLFYQCGFFRVSEKAVVHSHKHIIQYIHNIDGKKG